MPIDPKRIYWVLRNQHTAIDLLMARLIGCDPTFRPTQSGAIWDAIKEGHELFQDIEAEAAPFTRIESPGS